MKKQYAALFLVISLCIVGAFFFGFEASAGQYVDIAAYVGDDVSTAQEAVPDNTIVMTVGSKEATVFGEKVTNDVAPIIVNDRTMLPARFVAEALGATVKWEAEEQMVAIYTYDAMLIMYIDSVNAYYNGDMITLDTPPFIENDRTYLPLRLIAESLGASVEWDGVTSAATITKGDKEEGFSYQTADMSEYVKLGQYKGYTFEYTEPDEITDEDVEEYIFTEMGRYVEVTDETVKEHYGFDTVEEYRAYVKEYLSLTRESDILGQKGEIVFSEVMANAEVILPSGLLDERMVEEMKTAEELAMLYGMTLEELVAVSGTTLEEFEASLRAEVETAIKQEFAVMAVLQAEGIVPTKEECYEMWAKPLLEEYECSSLEELLYKYYHIPEKDYYDMIFLTTSKYMAVEFLAANSVFE